MKPRVFCAALLVCFIPALGQAASFYCPKATSLTDKFICNDGAISSADSDLAIIYIGLLADDTAGKDALRKSQREWLAKTHRDCPVTADGDKKKERECLLSAYMERTKSLIARWRQVAFNKAKEFRAGPYRFKTLIFKSKMVTYLGWGGEQLEEDMTGEFTLSIEHLVMTPLSDETAKPWNALNVLNDNAFINGCGGAGGQNTVTQEVKLASNQLLSIAETSLNGCDGAAHGGLANNFVSMYVMKPVPRPIVTGDFFLRDKRWIDKLIERCIKDWGNDLPNPDAQQDTCGGVGAPETWIITPDELIVTSTSPPPSDERQTSIPWSDLRDFLVPGAPIPTRNDYYYGPPDKQ